jgi:dTDP-4-dehydrorhamnose 3,5-epimerase
MIFEATPIPGLVLVDADRHVDERGFYARTWCAREFADAGLPDRIVQCDVSWNARRHTLRGMHWQAHPHGQTKLVRCTAGSIFDVAVDLRPESPTYLEHFGVELNSRNGRALFIPVRMAHGFLSLADETEVLYQMGSPYIPGAEEGARWDDPAFDITWPAPPLVMSGRDRGYPDFRPEMAEVGEARAD